MTNRWGPLPLWLSFPRFIVAVFAVVTLNFGLEGWFSDRVSKRRRRTSLDPPHKPMNKNSVHDLARDGYRAAGRTTLNAANARRTLFHVGRAGDARPF